MNYETIFLILTGILFFVGIGYLAYGIKNDSIFKDYTATGLGFIFFSMIALIVAMIIAKSANGS